MGIYNGNKVVEQTFRVKLAELDDIYPIGTVYQTTNATFNPNVSFGGTWTQIEQGRFLEATEEPSLIGTTKDAGLPNIIGTFFIGNTQYLSSQEQGGTVDGAFYRDPAGSYGVVGAQWTPDGSYHYFDASRCSSIYKNDITTVQPKSKLVFMWERTA